MYSLSEFSQQAIGAYNWTSFNPERRGRNTVSEAESELNADVSQLKSLGVGQDTIDRYVSKFKQRFSSWLGSESRCASSAVTGPSNFPVRKAERANEAARNKYEEFQAYRTRVLASIERQARKEFKQENGITPLVEARRNLNARIQDQAAMKKTNALIRQYARKGEAEQMAALMEMGHTPQNAATLLRGDSMGRIGYASYRLTNNNSQIVRLKERVEELLTKERRADQQAAGELKTEYAFTGGTIKLDYEDDRLRIHYDGKPDPDTISQLKRHAFKWSPTNMAWQRQLTGNAKYAASHLTGVKFN